MADFASGIANEQVWCKGEMFKADASKLLPIVCGVRDQCPLYRPRPTGERLLVVAHGNGSLGCNPYREWRVSEKETIHAFEETDV